MVFTRFGSTIKSIIRLDQESGWAVVTIERDGGKTEQCEVHLSDLRADGGHAEILAMAPGTARD